MSAEPWIIVDDTDTDQIQYTGPWFASDGSRFDDLGISGRPFENTLHGTSSNASFSFTFNGTFVTFFGTHEFPDPTLPVPSVQCIVLVNNIVDTTQIGRIGNNLQFCQIPELPVGQHTVIVNVFFPQNKDLNTPTNSFWFDSIQYEASPDWPLDNARIMVPTPDPRMQYGSGWRAALIDPKLDEYIGNITDIKDSTFTMRFVGESLSWFGYMNRSSVTTATTGSYAIDEGSPTLFNINATSLNLTSFLDINLMFFQTPTFDNGLHTLTVVYNGDAQENSTPLTLQYVVIQNGSSTSPLSASPSGSPSAAASSSPPPHSTSMHTAPIVGGVLGAVALIVVTVLLFCFLRRRRKRADNGDAYSIDESAHESRAPINPFIITTEDIFSDKTLERARPPGTESSTLTAVGIPQGPQKSTTRRVQNPESVSGTLEEESVRITGLGVIETPSSQPESTPTSRKSLTPVNGTPEMMPLPDSRLVSRGPRLVLRDEDSGIRLSSPGDEVVLLPPEYTLA